LAFREADFWDITSTSTVIRDVSVRVVVLFVDEIRLNVCYLFYKLNEMADSLTNSELLVMSAALHLGNYAYGVPIVEELERNRHPMSVATVYVVLARLEERGLVVSAMGEATPERGGRAKRYFRVTGKGVRQVRALQNTLVELWRDVPQLEGGMT
jgi:PadR family transcriptional regulator PadR